MARVFGFEDVGNHATMLVDAVRMRAFREAIRRAVAPDDVVVDVGSGSGILALLCAKAGARRVYAIERGPMARLIESAASKNGFADIVRVMRGDARAITFDEPPSLIVSDMIGSFAIDEDYLGLLGAVRARSAPACRVLPSSVEIELALACIPELDEEVETIRSGLGVRLDDLAAALQSRVALTWVAPQHLLSAATPAARFAVGDRPPRSVGGPAMVRRSARANVIVGWFNSELVDGVTLSSHPEKARTHWAHLVFPLAPALDVLEGATVELEVRPRLAVDRGTYAWSARCGPAASTGDAMKSIVGNRDDLIRQLGLRAQTLEPRDSERLGIWATALAGGVDETPVLAQRVRAAYPSRYADDADVEAEILRLVRAANT